MSKIFNFLFPFADFLYILQVEEYDSRRLVKWLPKFFLRRNFQVRDKLVFTKRVKFTLISTLTIWILSLVGTTLLLSSWVFVSVLWVVLIPIFVLVGNTLMLPYFEVIKSKIRDRARRKVEANIDLKIVNVAGSYGKTITKNFIFQLVQHSFRSQIVPGNINTPSGIADWINEHLESNTEVLVAELDTYGIGEIAKSSQMIPADIAVLTNVGDQHLERLGSEKELAQALSEVYLEAKDNVKLITTKETLVKLRRLDGVDALVIDRKKLDVKNTSESNKINLKFALKVAQLLGVPEKYLMSKIKSLELPDRRQKVSEMYGYEAVDDSYNISFTTALAGIAEAKRVAKRKNKKLLVLTAGIPELSKQNTGKNAELGRVLSREADQIVVLNSDFADDVISGGDESKMIRVDNLSVFLDETRKDFSVNEWLLLHQPELGDLYY